MPANLSHRHEVFFSERASVILGPVYMEVGVGLGGGGGELVGVSLLRRIS